MWAEIFFSKLFWQFEQENEQLFEQMSSLVDEVRQIEGKVIEISRLQEVFADKVLQQVRGATLWMYWCEEYCTVNLYYYTQAVLFYLLVRLTYFEKNITTLENAPLPLFGELLKFTAHGRIFERWWSTAFLVVWYRPRNWTLLLMSLLKLLRMLRLEMSKSDRWDDTTNGFVLFVLFPGQHINLPAVIWESWYPYVSDVGCVPVCGSLWGHVLLKYLCAAHSAYVWFPYFIVSYLMTYAACRFFFVCLWRCVS